MSQTLKIIDTHNHFDFPIFDNDRQELVIQAKQSGVNHMVITGYISKHFERIINTQNLINASNNTVPPTAPLQKLNSHIALGLHPLYINEHKADDLTLLDDMITQYRPIAIGEIGLDTYTAEMKQAANIEKQKHLFNAQLDLAVKHELPVLLHIRKSHADSIKILKQHTYNAHLFGGIAHSFSGGEQEAITFVKLGFKLGITGQITNPNAKKLRTAIIRVVDKFGLESIVIETDCPDMTPLACQHHKTNTQHTPRNIPSNLTFVLESLSQLLNVDKYILAKQLWHNSCQALKVNWAYD